MTDTEHKNSRSADSDDQIPAIDIRQAGPEDMASVLGWVNDPGLWYVDGIGPYRAQTLTEFLPVWEALLQQSNAWMIVCDGVAVGQIGWVESPDGLSAEIYITIGGANHRRRGIGRQALHWLEQRAAVMGLHHLVARVLKVNEAGLQFFSGLGYRSVPSRTTEVSRDAEIIALHWLEKSVPLAAH